MGHQRGMFCLLVLACINAVVTVSGAPHSDRIVSLPGQPAVPFSLYSGYVTVDEDHGRALFYFFVEATNNASSKPLVLWLNGGPGCSSLGGGAFSELGPFFPSPDGTPTLIANPYSWNREANIIFVESPAGVGFSYSNTSSDLLLWNDSRVADDSLVFLNGWIDKFPEYQGRDLYLAGEDYAGHYIPDLAVRIIKYRTTTAYNNFNLKGVLLGNPFLSLPTDMAASSNYTFSHGAMSEHTFESIIQNCNGFEDFDWGSVNFNVSIACLYALGASLDETDFINPYDIITDVCLPEAATQELTFKHIYAHQHQQQKKIHERKVNLGTDVCIDNQVLQYLSQRDVQQALNVPWQVSWILCTQAIGYNLSDVKRDMLPELVEIIQAAIPVMLFSGDQDTAIPFLGTRHLSIKLAQQLNLTASDYGVWFVDKQVAGWTQNFGPTNILTFATVRGAAHMVAISQPARALQLFASFLAHSPLPTTPPFYP